MSLPLLLILLSSATTSGRPAATDDSVRKTVVSAVTMGTVYLSAGRQDGLAEGTMVRVRRLGERAVYRVMFLSSRSAAARADSLTPLPQVGDTAEYVATKRSPDRSPSTAVASATGSGPRRQRFRGRVGLRFLSSADRGSGVSLRQPGLELLLDGPVGRSAPVGITADVRSRRSRLHRPGVGAAVNGTVGVYQANLRFQSATGRLRAVAGRQYAPTLAGIGLFDGMLVDYQRPRFGVGLMGGLEPEPGSLALSSEIRQYGGFVQVRGRPNVPVRWGLTTGAMGSYARGGVNREFAFLQATVVSRPVTAFFLQEVDYNRGWKRALGEPRFGFTSSFASVNVNPKDWISLNAGVDNRRTVRLYRDLLTPEEAFDDRFRLGVWGSMSLGLASNHVRIAADARSSAVSGSDSLGTSAWSGTVSLERLTQLGLGGRFRATRYRTPGHSPGTLLAAAIRVAPGSIGALEAGAGSRRELDAPSTDRYWAEVNGELFFQRSWFLLASFNREWGRGGATPTTEFFYAGISYRF